MVKRRILILAILIVVTALVMPGLGAAEKKTPKSIKVASVLSITGPFAGLGKQCERAYKVWVEKINADGGIYVKKFGKKIPVELKIYDDESSGVRTQFQLEVANQWGALVNLGGIGCSSFEMGTPMAQKNRMVWLGPGCGGWMPHQLGNKWMFNTLLKTPFLDVVFYMLMDQPEKTRPKKVAIFEINQLDCNEAALAWRQTAMKLGFPVVYHRKYAAGTKDFSALVTGAKKAGAEIVLGFPLPMGGPAIVKQMKMLDFNPKLIFFVRAPLAPNFAKDLGPISDYVCYSTYYDHKLLTAGNEDFVERHKEKYGFPPLPLTGPPYACAQVLAHAIESAGTLDRTAIRDAVRDTDMETVQGRIRFTPEGYAFELLSVIAQYMNQRTNVVYVRDWSKQYVENGQVKLVKFKYQLPWSAR